MAIAVPVARQALTRRLLLLRRLVVLVPLTVAAHSQEADDRSRWQHIVVQMAIAVPTLSHKKKEKIHILYIPRTK